MKYAIYLLLFILVAAVAACGDDNAGPSCDTSNITYTNTVKSIIDNNGCTNSNCHPAAFSGQNFSLATYDDVINFSRLPKLIDALRWDGAQEMPRDSTANPPAGLEMLPDCDIDKIEAWIAAGMPE